MSRLMLFPRAVERDPAVDVWMREHSGELGAIARRWFDVMRNCGDDVRELLHDGHPTACVGDAAFAYVNAFTAHVNVGFFLGAELADPDGLLEGTGKFMRHVKLRPGCACQQRSPPRPGVKHVRLRVPWPSAVCTIGSLRDFLEQAATQAWNPNKQLWRRLEVDLK